MISRREARIVPFAPDLMYAVVADVERYPEFLPWVLGLRVLTRGADRLTAEMMVGYGALRERYTSDIRFDPGALRIDVTQTRGPFKALENHWVFTAAEKGCKIDFAITFEFRNRMLAKLAGAAFDKAMGKMTGAFEARAQALSQQPQKAEALPAGNLTAKKEGTA